MVGLSLGHAGGHRSDPDFRHELHRNIGMGRDVLQVVNELGQVFDGVDVVVGRRRDQSHTRHRVTQLTDVFGDLTAGKLPTLARLGALGHLDLNLVGRHEVFGGHAKPARGHLLDL